MHEVAKLRAAEKAARDALDKSDRGTAFAKAIENRRAKKYSQARAILDTLLERTTAPIEIGLIKRECAQNYYQDPELPAEERFAKAFRILEEVRAAEENDPCETLCLMGAVAKRRWLVGGQAEHLKEAINFYRAAVDADPAVDHGYGAVNAAYLLLVEAENDTVLAQRTGTPALAAQRLRGEATALYEQTADRLSAVLPDASLPDGVDPYYHYVTLAEALFGLQRFEDAAEVLKKAHQHSHGEQDRHITFRQMADLVRRLGIELPREDKPLETWPHAWRSLSWLLKEEDDDAERHERRIRSALKSARGKVGLALSGGGFRAAFYHLGVMARLAEMDILRSVEAISTVSGGSVVGMHYYLELKKMLEAQPDATLSKDDYLCLVERTAENFFTGVEKNIRTRTFMNLWENLRIILAGKKSRTNRVGELYQKHLYDTVFQDSGNSPTSMSDLKIAPKDASDPSTFNPKYENWDRTSKVPVLLVNTTSLNSGHNWRFTATWMGEPPGLADDQIDKNARYPWQYYETLPDPHKRVTIGDAVAASSCVPGLFEPLPFDGLHGSGRTIRLVDGGVHDNQGIQALLDEDCDIILCSDSSGQMADDQNPSNHELGVVLRSNSIMMDRIREVQFQDLRARLDTGALKGMLFVHLKQGLSAPVVPLQSEPEPQTGVTDYGIDRDVQAGLAALRTDLDAFTEVEAYSLMVSGYLHTVGEFGKLNTNWCRFDVNAPKWTDQNGIHRWFFLDKDLLEVMKQPPGSSEARKDLGDQLRIGSKVAFKPFSRVSYLRTLKWVLAGVLAILGLWGAYIFWETPLIDLSAVRLAVGITIGSIIIALLFLALTLFKPIAEYLNPQEYVKGKARMAAVSIAVTVGCLTHVYWFDRAFLKKGRLNVLKALRHK